jgi:aminoglycoside 6'-N-acetyltransferase I
MVVERCTRASFEDWLRLRQALCLQASEQELRLEAAAMVDRPDDAVAFIARDAHSKVVAFAEATMRHDYVNGCGTSPVAFLEGIYVHPQWRNRGLARLLCNAVEDWAIGLGCTEFASDVELHNEASQRAHQAIGFDETEHVIYYRKELRR